MDTSCAFCTIVASNYLASARTLCQSLRKLHPDVPRYVLFIDDNYRSFLGEAESFQAISLEEINLDSLDLLRFSYDVVELATVVKPYFLKYLIRRFGLAKVAYFDPDIIVLNPLDDLLKCLDQSNFVLTPHLDADYPDDGYAPDIANILLHGLYNLGFIACRSSPEGLRFLDWWDDKIRRKCTRDYSTAHFVDQKIVDLAPLLFEGVHVETGPGYNAAYWNIHSRTISFTNGRWFSNDQPLCFFHFSGFDPKKPEALAKGCTRPVSAQNRDLLVLQNDYAQRLVENDHLALRQLSYGYSRFANGDDILYTTRHYFRMSEQLQLEESTPFHSPRIIRWNRATVFENHHRRTYRFIRKIWPFARRPILALSRALRLDLPYLGRELYL